MAEVLIVGENSFIGSDLHKNGTDSNFTKVSYRDIDNIDFTRFDVVVNCALHPYFKDRKYHTSFDVDYEVACKAYKAGCYYVMLSTRKIYGSNTELQFYTETDPERPYDFYSENKLKAEKKILERFGDASAVLRGSNLFGNELGRNSMMGYMLNQLDKTGKIVYNQSPSTQKDILHVGDASTLISAVCIERPAGLFNMGGGIYSLGEMGQHLIEGYGQGELVCENTKMGEQFGLDSSKLRDTLGIMVVPLYEETLFNIGASLCKI